MICRERIPHGLTPRLPGKAGEFGILRFGSFPARAQGREPASPQVGDERSQLPVQGFAILQAGLKAQLRSTPTTHHSTPQVAPISAVSSPIE